MFGVAVLQGPGMGESPEAADMLSTLQAMSGHGGLPGVLNNPMQPPFPQQVLPNTWVQPIVLMLIDISNSLFSCLSFNFLAAHSI